MCVGVEVEVEVVGTREWMDGWASLGYHGTLPISYCEGYGNILGSRVLNA